MFFAAVAICGASSGARAQSFADYPDARIDTYLVRGVTPAEIFASITRNAPGMIHAGRPAHAYASTRFRWTQRQTGAVCEFEVFLDTTVTFPRHVDPAGLTDEAWLWWRQYIQALEMHEAGHLKIAYEAYPEIVYALKNGPCKDANARAQLVLEDLNRRQELYDQMTDHGAVTSRAFG
mgnify:CR=1 FL=1